MNTKIVVAVVVIAGSSIVNAWYRKKPITAIVIGSYILLLILSIMDMFGGKISALASALAMVAVVYVLIGVDPKTKQSLFPWDLITNLAQGKKVA